MKRKAFAAATTSSGYCWKDKILDYEIETKATATGSKGLPMISWKDKILDYEIETTQAAQESQAFMLKESWKDKILDYEIETL